MLPGHATVRKFVMDTLPDDGWHELLIQLRSSSDFNDDDNENQSSDGDIMEVNKPVVEPNLILMKDVNVLLRVLAGKTEQRKKMLEWFRSFKTICVKL